MSKPQLKTVAKYFCKAKSVRCLSKGIVVDVSKNKDYVYNRFDNAFTSVGGAVTFWNDGFYAEIHSVDKKCNCK